MKQFIVLLFWVLTCTASYAQKKIVRFCEITGREVGLVNGKLRIDMVIGKADSVNMLRERDVMEMTTKVKSFTTIPDVLDYMYASGWSLVAENEITGLRRFYFKKEFGGQEK